MRARVAPVGVLGVGCRPRPRSAARGARGTVRDAPAPHPLWSGPAARTRTAARAAGRAGGRIARGAPAGGSRRAREAAARAAAATGPSWAAASRMVGVGRLRRWRPGRRGSGAGRGGGSETLVLGGQPGEARLRDVVDGARVQHRGDDPRLARPQDAQPDEAQGAPHARCSACTSAARRGVAQAPRPSAAVPRRGGPPRTARGPRRRPSPWPRVWPARRSATPSGSASAAPRGGVARGPARPRERRRAATPKPALRAA